MFNVPVIYPPLQPSLLRTYLEDLIKTFPNKTHISGIIRRNHKIVEKWRCHFTNPIRIRIDHTTGIGRYIEIKFHSTWWITDKVTKVQTNKRPSFLAHVKTPSCIWKKSQKGMFEISEEDLLTCICYSLYRCCPEQFLSPTKRD